jgi:hypothetical protein
MNTFDGTSVGVPGSLGWPQADVPFDVGGALAANPSAPLREAIGVRYRPGVRIWGCGAPMESAVRVVRPSRALGSEVRPA